MIRNTTGDRARRRCYPAMTALLACADFFLWWLCLRQLLGSGLLRIPRGMSLVLPRSQCPAVRAYAGSLRSCAGAFLRCCSGGDAPTAARDLWSLSSDRGYQRRIGFLFFLRYGLSCVCFRLCRLHWLYGHLLLAVIDLECRRLPNMLTIFRNGSWARLNSSPGMS